MDLRSSFERAHGESRFVIAVFADIRGFSHFSRVNESPNVAVYVKRVYLRLIDEYFPNARYYKATGDGLLIIIEYDESDFEEKARYTIDGCLRCVVEFPNICTGDPMVNFATPDRIGFGVARGTACCLLDGDELLDYSGHVLNLAARLQDLARPLGVVIDGNFGMGLLDEKTQALFRREDAYVRSVAEIEPTAVFIQSCVELSEASKRPIAFEQWTDLDMSQYPKTVAEWKSFAPKMSIHLPKKLKRPDGLALSLSYSSVKSGKIAANVSNNLNCSSAYYSYAEAGGKPRIVFESSKVLELARTNKLPQAAKMVLRVSYIAQ